MQPERSGIRINRYFTENGLISRREADAAVARGQVKINGRLAVPGDRVQAGDQIMYKGQVLRPKSKSPTILAFNKPIGIECTTNLQVPANIIEAVRYPERVFPIGRLDKDSEGLILLTNIGEIVNKILRSEHEHEKEYIVHLSGPIDDQGLTRLRQGMRLEDGMTKPCRVYRESALRLRMLLTEGRNRQIRRMIQALGLEVLRLKRVRIMTIELGALAPGAWRKLRRTEIETLYGTLG